MKVDMVTPRFHPSVGGIEESVFQLASGLQGRGHSVVVHTLRSPGASDRERLRGLEIRRYSATKDRGYYVSRFEPRLEGDVVHLHAYAHQTNDWVIDRYADRVPVFLSTHHGARFPKPRLSAKLYHAWYNRFRGVPRLSRLAGLLVPTGYDADYFASRGVDSERIHVVPSGADEAAFQRHAPWAPDGCASPFLLFFGRWHEEKGLPELLAAHALLPQRSALVIAGRDEGGLDGVDRAALRDRNVHLVQDPSPSQHWGLMAACRGLVLPSRYEGQGIVVAEAWAQGKPVIASRGGALPWVVDDFGDGLLVPVGDVEALATAMRRLYEDEDLGVRLGEAGRRKAEERFRWPHIVERVERLYAASIAARAAASSAPA